MNTVQQSNGGCVPACRICGFANARKPHSCTDTLRTCLNLAEQEVKDLKAALDTAATNMRHAAYAAEQIALGWSATTVASECLALKRRLRMANASASAALGAGT